MLICSLGHPAADGGHQFQGPQGSYQLVYTRTPDGQLLPLAIPSNSPHLVNLHFLFPIPWLYLDTDPASFRHLLISVIAISSIWWQRLAGPAGTSYSILNRFNQQPGIDACFNGCCARCASDTVHPTCLPNWWLGLNCMRLYQVCTRFALEALDFVALHRGNGMCFLLWKTVH